MLTTSGSRVSPASSRTDEFHNGAIATVPVEHQTQNIHALILFLTVLDTVIFTISKNGTKQTEISKIGIISHTFQETACLKPQAKEMLLNKNRTL